MESFGTILIIIVLVGIVVAAASYIGSGGIYQSLGKTGLTLDEPDLRPEPMAGSAAANAEAQEEIRQMLEAKSDRQVARGEDPLDIDEEILALATPAASAAPADAGLRAEVRELVVARNERRMRRGEEPLEIEAEVDRQLREFGA
ncbi:MAG: hypothetical protein WKF32_04355 [Thermoleophilaceae bacterium]